MQLNELKKALDQSKLAIQESKKLVEEREKLHGELVKIKEQIEGYLLDLERNKTKQKSDLKKGLEKKTAELAHIKDQIRKLDTKLDQIGEEQETTFERMQQKIVQEIGATFPNFKEIILALEEKRQEGRKKEQELVHMKEKLTPFYNALQEGKHTRRRGSFWEYLFGRHPKVLLARSIQKGIDEAEKVKGQIGDPNFEGFIYLFLDESSKKWNKGLYNDKFQLLVKEFSQLMEDLIKKIEIERLHLLDLDKEMEQLIESYCQKAQI